jgi:hypothetical protein
MRRANSSRVTRAFTVRTSIVADGGGASSTPTPGTNCAARPATPAQMATIVATTSSRLGGAWPALPALRWRRSV